MALVLEILLGVMILASFFVAFMSAKSWQVYQAVLVVFVFLGTVAFFYLGARTLATHNAWGKYVADRQKELAGLDQQIEQVVNGGGQNAAGQPSQSILKLQQELHALVVDRGGMISQAVVDSVKDGVVQLTLPSAGHGLLPNTVVYAFDEAAAADGGRYRGEFKVVSAAEKTVQLTPNLPLSPIQMQSLATVKGPWMLYMSMPIDDAEMFASLDDATRQSLVPKESLESYAHADRPLRDYGYFFHENALQRGLLADAISKITNNIERTSAATIQANKEIAYRGTEKTALQSDLEKFQHEQTVITAYQQTLSKQYQQVRKSLMVTYAGNKQAAAELTASQEKSASEIDQRGAARASAP